VGDAPFNVNFRVKVNPAVSKPRFSQFTGVTAAVTVRKQLIYSLKTIIKVGISPAPRSLCGS